MREWIRTVKLRLRSLIYRRQLDRDLQDELAYHLELRRANAPSRAPFGNVTLIQEACRDMWTFNWVEDLGRDVRHALRSLQRTPVFTAVAVLTLALGIGANTAIFSLFEAVLLRPMAVVDPDRIAAVYTSDSSSTQYGASSYPDYEDFLQSTTAFSDIAAYRQTQLSMNAGADTEVILGEIVSGNYFSMLGLRADLGRPLLKSDDLSDAPHATVISHNLWLSRFASDPGVVGRTVQFNGQPFTIAGVAARGFVGGMRPHSVDAWITIRASRVLYPPERFTWIENRGSRGLGLLGRLRDDATIDGAQAEFDVIAGRLYESYRQEWRNVRNTGRTISVVAEPETRVPPDFNGPIFAFMSLLMVVVGLVLLTACANLANLLLARGTANAREIGMRLALGSSRGRIIRQLLTENILLSMAGGVAGLAVAWVLMRALLSFKPPIAVPVAVDLRLDPIVLAFTLGVSVITGIVTGLAPAIHAARKDLLPILKDNAVGSPRRSRLSRAFVIVQVALSVLLMIGAGLFLRSLHNVTAADAGFDPAKTIVMTLNPALQGYNEVRGRALYEKVLQHIGGLPEVQSTSLAMSVPLNLVGSRRGTVIEGYQPEFGEDMEISMNVVGPRYFETMRIPLLRGRSFDDSDRAESLPAIIVNQAFVQRYWPGLDPLGKRVSANGDRGPFREVVGVVPTGKYNTLGEDPRPFYYVPLWQEYRGSVSLHVRTTGDPRAALSSVRAGIRSIDGIVPVFDAKTMEDQLLLTLLPARIAGILLGMFGTLALLLASVGTYGLMSYSVAQKTREMGVRLALGAAPRDLLLLVVGDGLRLVFIGMVLGGAAAATITSLIAPLLYGITPHDPVAFAGAIIVFGCAALLACYLPARRVIRIDPVVALRFQ